MKTILVPTDFSPPADNAARYAFHLAKRLWARVRLCHAIKVPAETQHAMQVEWPLEDYTSLKAEVVQQLTVSIKKLMKEEGSVTNSQIYRPEVEYSSEIGNVTDVIRNIVDDQKISLVVMGMSGASEINKLFLGSNSRDIIEKANFPVLLIPAKAAYKPIQKIGFATDLSKGDVELIHSLASLAQPFNAEVLLVHVADDKTEQPAHQHKLDDFLNEVTCKINYSKIYFRLVKNTDVTQGLDWMTEYGMINMLVMVHRQAGFLKMLFEGSHTQKQAARVDIPLLVLPANMHPVWF
jgi:nucleotide-binding universal stress UspA family protein